MRQNNTTMSNKKSFRECLSENDQKVLQSLFVPAEIGGPIPEEFSLDVEAEVTDTPEEQTPEVKESIKFEVEAIRLAEAGKLDEALDAFDRAIKVAPNRGSVYNNRAQTLRLKGNDEGALNDLAKAIELCSNQPRTRCQALCQRGLLYRKMENNDAARPNFEAAARLGSKFARIQLVEINPYAALCNQMLQAAYTKMQWE